MTTYSIINLRAYLKCKNILSNKTMQMLLLNTVKFNKNKLTNLKRIKKHLKVIRNQKRKNLNIIKPIFLMLRIKLINHHFDNQGK